MIKKYRRKPVEVEAVQWDGTNVAWLSILSMGLKKWHPGETGSDTFIVETTNDFIVVRKGDYIVKDDKGKIYPCTSDFLQETFELI